MQKKVLTLDDVDTSKDTRPTGIYVPEGTQQVDVIGDSAKQDKPDASVEMDDGAGMPNAPKSDTSVEKTVPDGENVSIDDGRKTPIKMSEERLREQYGDTLDRYLELSMQERNAREMFGQDGKSPNNVSIGSGIVREFERRKTDVCKDLSAHTGWSKEELDVLAETRKREIADMRLVDLPQNDAVMGVRKMIDAPAGMIQRTPEELKAMSDKRLLEEYCALDARLYGNAMPDDKNSSLFNKLFSGANHSKEDKRVKDHYAEYHDLLANQCALRGYSPNQLADISQGYRAAVAQAPMGTLNGSELTIRMQAAVHNDNQADLDLYRAMTMSKVDQQTTVGYKGLENARISLYEDVLAPHSNAYRLDAVKSSVYPTVLASENPDLACRISMSGQNSGMQHCDSPYLGSFDYDPKKWAIGYQTMEGTEDSQRIPTLRYIGSETKDIQVPNGVRVLDNTFAGTQIERVPALPDSVISAHGAFAGCDSLHGFDKTALKLEKEPDDSALFPEFGRPKEKSTWALPAGLKDSSYMFYDCRHMSFGEVDKIEYPKDLCAKGMYANMPWDRFERYDGVMDSLFVNPGERRAELVPDVKTMLNPDTERPLAALARQQRNSKDVYMNFEYPLPDPKYPPVTLSAAPTYPTQVAQPIKFNAKTLVSEPKDLPKSVMEPVGKIREGKSLAGAALMHGLREPATGFAFGHKSKPSRTLAQTTEETAPAEEPQVQTVKEAPAKPNLQDVRNKRIEKAQALLDGTIEKKPGKSTGVSAQNRGDIDLV